MEEQLHDLRVSSAGLQGYTIRVVPGVALDSKYRYYTHSARVYITKEGTDYFWVGRTDTKRVRKVSVSSDMYMHLVQTQKRNLKKKDILSNKEKKNQFFKFSFCILLTLFRF